MMINWTMPEGATHEEYAMRLAANRKHVFIECFNEFTNEVYHVLVVDIGNHVYYHEFHGNRHIMLEVAPDELLKAAYSETCNRTILSMSL